MNQPPATLAPNPPSEQPRVAAAPGSRPCQECGSPMDRRQRYCINCAARRADVSNPASRYFAAASRQRRTSAATPAPGGAGASSTGGARTAAVFFFVLLPIAVAVGVLVGRSGSDSDADKVLAALRDGSVAPTAASADAAKAETVSNSSQLLTSDFTLDKGFTVKLGLLPIDGTDQAAADDATSEAEDKGGKDVGIINPGDFTTDPDQGQDSYVLYSGEFEDRAAAEKALDGLKRDFPDAEVIAVDSGAAAGKSDDIGKVVAKTSHGTVHEVTAAPPSEEQVAHDTAIVNYTDLQQSLPDVTVVGGNPEDAPPLPTGAGD